LRLENMGKLETHLRLLFARDWTPALHEETAGSISKDRPRISISRKRAAAQCVTQGTARQTKNVGKFRASRQVSRKENLHTKNESKSEYRWSKPTRRQLIMPANFKICPSVAENPQLFVANLQQRRLFSKNGVSSTLQRI
jgi:hypothetical protein